MEHPFSFRIAFPTLLGCCESGCTDIPDNFSDHNNIGDFRLAKLFA